jgi:flagellar basal body-associated protein FliL
VPHTSRHPVHELRIAGVGKHPSVCCWLLLLLLLLLLSLALCLLALLALSAVVEQESQGTTKGKYNERLEDVTVNVIVVAVAPVNMFVVVIHLIIVSARELGFKEGAEPF